MEDVMKGNFTMRLLYDQLSNIMKMGSVSQLMSLIPGFSNSLMPKVCLGPFRNYHAYH